ncbi:MAG: hypothetical protein IT373_09030 [Polyangiaceae bacterium]|nr:hypothetical protein [Polyangiaceae bacterium]
MVKCDAPARSMGGYDRARALVALAFGLALLAGPARARALEHPPDLVAEGECEAWIGTVSGNDPSVRVSARLCPAGGDAVKGQLQWSSLKSGYSVRDVEGRWLDGKKKLEMRDVRVAESHPNPGWVFCTVDKYDLALETPNELRGTYVSAACRDHARVMLSRVPKPPAPPGSGTATAPSSGPAEPGPPGSASPPGPGPDPRPTDGPDVRPPPPVADDPPPRPRDRRSGCSCEAVAADGRRAPVPLGLALVALVALGRARRRP